MRNPFNTNQTLYLEPSYNGFPVQSNRGPLIEPYLKRLYGLFVAAMNQYNYLHDLSKGDSLWMVERE